MLIILEGADGVGKSTLAQRLRQRLLVRFPEDRVEVIKKGPPREHPLNEYVKPLLDYRPRTGHHIICDRWHWGERVYPSVLRRGTKMNEAVWRYTELFLESRGALVVAIGRSPAEHLRAFTERGDDLIRPDQLAELRRRYVQVQETSLLRSIAYRAVQHDYNEIHDEIINHARTQASLLSPLSRFTTYVGPRWPKMLLLGDVRNGEFAEGTGTAFGPYPATSGQYLMRALGEAGFRFEHIGIANACDVDDPVALWKTLREPRIVTLGSNAHQRLRVAGLPHGAVPHPQFVRRFHHKEHRWYGELIRSALTGGDLRACRPTPSPSKSPADASATARS